MGKVIAIANQKGGVGKTTTTLNVGAALEEAGKRTLLVDFDPQAALTSAFGLVPMQLKRTIYHVLIDDDLDIRSTLLTTEHGPDLVPANIHLSGAEVELLHKIGREAFLKDKLAAVRQSYDVILIDCPPSLGLLTINALTAADEVLIPVQTEIFALQAIEQLLTIIKQIKSKANPHLQIGGILATMYQSRTRHSQEVLEELRAAFPNQVYTPVIKRTTKFPDSVIVIEDDFAGPPEARSILTFDPRSEYAEAYRQLAQEIVV